MRQKGFAPIIILLVLVGIGLLAYFGFFYKPSTQPSPQSTSYVIPTSPASATPDPTANWSVHTDTVLGIEYKLPPKLGLLDMSGKEIPGDTGIQYCAVYVGNTSFIIKPLYAGVGPCGGGVFSIGAVSKDYSAGREGGYGDLTGYIPKNGKYYPRFINSQSQTALPANLVRETTNSIGFKYLRVTGQNAMQDRGGELMDIPIPGTPGKGFIGALINLSSNQEFAGFNIQMEVGSPKDEQIFDQILSTFKFLNNEESTVDSLDTCLPKNEAGASICYDQKTQQECLDLSTECRWAKAIF